MGADMTLDEKDNIIDSNGRKVVPSEFMAYCVYSASLEVCSCRKQFDGRISLSDVTNALSKAGISTGLLTCRIRRNFPRFCITESCVDLCKPEIRMGECSCGWLHRGPRTRLHSVCPGPSQSCGSSRAAPLFVFHSTAVVNSCT